MHFLHLMYSKRFVEMYPRVSRAILAYNSDQYNRHFHGNSFCTRLWWVLMHRQMTVFFFFFPTLCLWAMSLWVLWLNLAACAGVCVLKAGFPAKVLLLSVSVVLNQNRNKSWQHCTIYNVDPPCGSDWAAGTVLNYSTQTLLNQTGGNNNKPLTLQVYKLWHSLYFQSHFLKIIKT